MTRRRRDRSGPIGGLMLSPLVASLRMPILLSEASSLGNTGAETARAMSEKAAAAAEGLVAAQVSIANSMLSFWPEMLSGQVPALLSGVAAERSLRAAMVPASRRVRANYKRLSKG